VSIKIDTFLFWIFPCCYCFLLFFYGFLYTAFPEKKTKSLKKYNRKNKFGTVKNKKKYFFLPRDY